MSKTSRVLIPLVATLLLGTAGLARAGSQVDVGFFYDSLAPYGQWMVHARFGNVWQPRGVEAGWRPYTHGHWGHEPDGQRLWVSDYPWGWAPFHYGRWYPDPALGWVWVPGNVWAPAWVAWRTGGGYVGWAPLPPDVGDDDGEFDGQSFDDGYGAGGYAAGGDWGGAPYWSFVGEAEFWSPGLHIAILPAYRNVTIIHNTMNITHYEVRNHRPFDRSFDDHGRWGEHHRDARPDWRDAQHREDHWAPRPEGRPGGRPGEWRDDRGRDDDRRNIQPVRRVEPDRPAWNGSPGWPGRPGRPGGRTPPAPAVDERPARPAPEPGTGGWHPREGASPPATPAWRNRPGVPEANGRTWHPVETPRSAPPERPTWGGRGEGRSAGSAPVLRPPPRVEPPAPPARPARPAQPAQPAQTGGDHRTDRRPDHDHRRFE